MIEPVPGSASANALTKDISTCEIKAALFDIGKDKALGQDGYTSCFFKKA